MHSKRVVRRSGRQDIISEALGEDLAAAMTSQAAKAKNHDPKQHVPSRTGQVGRAALVSAVNSSRGRPA
jgi:hypothetical protein